MNINIFEKTQHTSNDYQHSDSSSHDDVANLKLKIEKRKSKQRRIKTVIITLVASVLILASLFTYSQYKLYKLSKEEVSVVDTAEAKQNTATSTQVGAQKSPESIIKALGKHIMLPDGTPQIAEVQDVEKLKEKQAFFKNAQNGDIVVVYESTIFLYRPSVDIVVASGDISGVEQKNP